VQLLEKRSGGLTPLPDNFFVDCHAWFALQDASLKKSFSLDAARVRDGAERILREIIELRKQKVLLKALRDIRAGEVDSEGLASEEKHLYTQVVKVLNELECSLAGKASVASDETGGVACVPVSDGFLNVRILADFPEAFVGSDGHEYGPFTALEVVRLAREQALSLIRRNAAEEAHDVQTLNGGEVK